MKRKTNELRIEFNEQDELFVESDVQSISKFTALLNSLISGDLDEAIFASVEKDLIDNGMNDEVKYIQELRKKMNSTFQNLLDKITEAGNQSIMNPSQFR